MNEELFDSFAKDVQSTALELTTPETDPLPAYLSQVATSADDVKVAYRNVRFGTAGIEGVRNRLIQIAALCFHAHRESYRINVDIINDKGMVSTAEAMALFQQITGEIYTKSMMSLMVQSRELKVVTRERIAGTGRPSNFFRKRDVIAAARRRAEK